jgi:hypothetical protein
VSHRTDDEQSATNGRAHVESDVSTGDGASAGGDKDTRPTGTTISTRQQVGQNEGGEVVGVKIDTVQGSVNIQGPVTVNVPGLGAETLRDKETTSRRADLEQHIRDSYEIIREYERMIQTSDRPEEKLRARRTIEEQWNRVREYLAEYARLVNGTWPRDIAEITAHFNVDSNTAG